MRLLDEHQLAREEVAHLDELRVLCDERVRALLVGEADVHAEGAVPARALGARGHDPGARAGHDHPAVRRELASEVACEHVDRVLGCGARRAEHRDLAHVAPGTEDLEGLSHLLQRGVGDLQVEGVDCPRARAAPRSRTWTRRGHAAVGQSPAPATSSSTTVRTRSSVVMPSGVEGGALHAAADRAGATMARELVDAHALPVRRARGARDVLVHQRAAEVVGARDEHLARALGAELHPGDLDVVDGAGVARAARRRA